jgi:DNA-binding MarR family transcriptional regulator
MTIDGTSGDVRRSISLALRRHGATSTRMMQAFALANGMRPSDLQALVAIITADDAGEPLTPARLREQIRLSSAGTTYVVDRLEEGGYVRRTQDHPANRRMVRLRYTDQGIETVTAFFRPISRATSRVMDRFDEAELLVVERFLSAAADAVAAEVRDVNAAAPPARGD